MKNKNEVINTFIDRYTTYIADMVYIPSILYPSYSQYKDNVRYNKDDDTITFDVVFDMHGVSGTNCWNDDSEDYDRHRYLYSIEFRNNLNNVFILNNKLQKEQDFEHFEDEDEFEDKNEDMSNTTEISISKDLLSSNRESNNWYGDYSVKQTYKISINNIKAYLEQCVVDINMDGDFEGLSYLKCLSEYDDDDNKNKKKLKR